MFIRFRRQANRLQASLVQSRRASGRVHAEHIGALGSVDADVSLRSRVAFWAKIHDRLAALGNRVGADEHPKILGALNTRIPMVTPDEVHAVQEESFKDDERFWDAMRDLSAASVEENKSLIAGLEAKIAALEPEVAKAGEKVEVARTKLAKLKRGEAVTGGLGKRLDLRAVIKPAGITPRMLRRMLLFADMSETEFEALHAPTVSKRLFAAADKIVDREARRIIRART